MNKKYTVITTKSHLPNGRSNPLYRATYYNLVEKKRGEQRIKSKVGYVCPFCRAPRMFHLFEGLHKPEVVVWLYKGRGKIQLVRKAEKLNPIYASKLEDFLGHITFMAKKFLMLSNVDLTAKPISEVSKIPEISKVTEVREPWQLRKFVNGSMSGVTALNGLKSVTKISQLSVKKLPSVTLSLLSKQKSD